MEEGEEAKSGENRPTKGDKMNIGDKCIQAMNEYKKNPHDKKLLKRAMRLYSKATNKAKMLGTPTDCKKCGICCGAYWMELSESDIKREPRLLKISIPFSDVPVKTKEKISNSVRVIPTKSKDYPEGHTQCPFLMKNNEIFECDIYETRPDTCRRFFPSRITCHNAFLESKGMDVVQSIEAMMKLGIPGELIVCKLMDYWDYDNQCFNSAIYMTEEVESKENRPIEEV